MKYYRFFLKKLDTAPVFLDIFLISLFLVAPENNGRADRRTAFRNRYVQVYFFAVNRLIAPYFG